MSMASEFKTFIQRGNVIDMAIGIIMGGAFGKIVSSFVGDVLMPPIGLALGGVDFAEPEGDRRRHRRGAGDDQLRRVRAERRRLPDRRFLRLPAWSRRSTR